MNDPLKPTLDPSLRQHLQVDRLCDRFEAEWAAGERPSIEDLLSDVAPAAREDLFRELLRLEIAIRRSAGETPTIADYASRFPTCADLVEEILSGASDTRDFNIETHGQSSADPHETIPQEFGVPPHLPGVPALQRGRYDIVRAHAKGGLGAIPFNPA